MLTRRQLLKRTGALFAVLPFLAVPQVVNAEPKALGGVISGQMVHGSTIAPSNHEHTHSMKGNLHSIPIYPDFYYSPVNNPTKDDPLGQFGFVSIKYQVGDKHYGDWIKITDLLTNEKDLKEVLKLATDMLVEVSQKKLAITNPQAYLVIPRTIKPTYLAL